MTRITDLAKLSAVALALGAFSVVGFGCESSNDSLEDAGDNISDAADDAGDAVGDAAEEAGDNIQDALD